MDRIVHGDRVERERVEEDGIGIGVSRLDRDIDPRPTGVTRISGELGRTTRRTAPVPTQNSDLHGQIIAADGRLGAATGLRASTPLPSRRALSILPHRRGRRRERHRVGPKPVRSSSRRRPCTSGFTDSPIGIVLPADSGRVVARRPDRRARTGWSASASVDPATGFTTALIDLDVCSNSERGLLGLAPDPAFLGNGWVYVYYTARRQPSGCVNRVSRFTMLGDSISPTSASSCWSTTSRRRGGNHNGGDLDVGSDGNPVRGASATPAPTRVATPERAAATTPPRTCRC